MRENMNETIETLKLALERIATDKESSSRIKHIANRALVQSSDYSHLKRSQPVMVTNSNETDCPNVYQVSYFSGVIGACITDIKGNAYRHCLTLQEFADKFAQPDGEEE